MFKRLASAFFLAFAIAPASAVDLGVSVGGANVGGKVSLGRDGTSVGLGAKTGGAGKVDANANVGGLGVNGGTSVGTGGASVTAGAGIGTKSIGAGVGTTGGVASPGGGKVTKGTAGTTRTATTKGNIGSSLGATGVSPAGSTSKKSAVGTAVTTSAVVPTTRAEKSLTLPRILLPHSGKDRVSKTALFKEVPGIPTAIVRACRGAVETAADPYGAVDVSAKSSGSLRRLDGGLVSAPIYVRIKYQREGGAEVRQARIKCQLTAAGKVVKLG